MLCCAALALLHSNELVLLNSEEHPTFTFHIIRKVLDICICTKNISRRSHLQVIPQPYSDHAALLIDVDL